MKTLITITVSLLAAALIAFGGKPINLSEAEASNAADVVMVATIKVIENVSHPGPFDIDDRVKSETGQPFAQFATVSNFRVLLGNAPKTVRIYGGKVGTMTDFRIETGESMLLLKKLGEASYRAVDWNYGLMPVKEGKVEWTITKLPRTTEWISIEEALRRITDHKKRSDQAVTPNGP